LEAWELEKWKNSKQQEMFQREAKFKHQKQTELVALQKRIQVLAMMTMTKTTCTADAADADNDSDEVRLIGLEAERWSCFILRVCGCV